MLDHATWNEVFYYWDTNLSWIYCIRLNVLSPVVNCAKYQKFRTDKINQPKLRPPLQVLISFIYIVRFPWINQNKLLVAYEKYMGLRWHTSTGYSSKEVSLLGAWVTSWDTHWWPLTCRFVTSTILLRKKKHILLWHFETSNACLWTIIPLEDIDHFQADISWSSKTIEVSNWNQFYPNNE